VFSVIKGFTWKLLLNRTNAAGSRLLFTNSGGRNMIDITTNPILADQIISEVLERPWAKEDLMDYLDTMSGNYIEKNCPQYKA